MENNPIENNTENIEKKNSINLSRNTLAIILVVLVVAFVGYVYFNRVPASLNSAIVSEDLPAAIVNGEVISVKDLDKAYNSLPEQYKKATTKESLLNQLIQVKVLYKEAEKEGLIATVEEAQQSNYFAVNIQKTNSTFTINSIRQITINQIIGNNNAEYSVKSFDNGNLLIEELNYGMQNNGEYIIYIPKNAESFEIYEENKVLFRYEFT